MAIRARIKSKIKSLLFGTTKKEVAPATPAPQTFTAPTVSTTATSSVQHGSSNQELENKAPSADSHIDSDRKTAQSTEEPGVVENKETQNLTDATTEKPAETDTENATFIIEVTELFPEVCPHCEASSHNNWIRIENKFACGSCEAAY